MTKSVYEEIDWAEIRQLIADINTPAVADSATSTMQGDVPCNSEN